MSILPNIYTTEEFETFIHAPENRERRFELINGEIVEKVPTQRHGMIAAKVTTALGIYLEKNPIGWLGVEVRHSPEDDAHNDRLPDVALTLDTESPVVEEGAVTGMPDLAVEIKSPHDSYRGMRAKADFYLANGSKMVWLIYPEQKLVEVYQTDTDIQILTTAGTIDGGDLLPGFSLPVSKIFRR